ncbi:hypothetical protein SOM26_15920 [Sphingomonas sp. CFBP8993]|uniref:hypothetical protein n=1 Tax=Sphingomonas sp. CFBP8993 TaxID=3096526 RepID=UPI002A6B623B|nr:hypothetical protein [Sphingomonas sp. CFBP8993]MDY0960182.1 hypothetical protein [Sphingomonas sp. CFBP8993]
MHVHIRQQFAAFGLRAEPVEAHRVEPLEDVAALAMLGDAAVFVMEADDILEAGYDPFLARGAGADLLGGQVDAEFGKDIVVGHVSH